MSFPKTKVLKAKDLLAFLPLELLELTALQTGVDKNVEKLLIKENQIHWYS